MIRVDDDGVRIEQEGRTAWLPFGAIDEIRAYLQHGIECEQDLAIGFRVGDRFVESTWNSSLWTDAVQVLERHLPQMIPFAIWRDIVIHNEHGGRKDLLIYEREPSTTEEV